MRLAPNEWTGHTLIAHVKTGPQQSCDGKRYEPARPIGFYSLRNRVRFSSRREGVGDARNQTSTSLGHTEGA